MNDFIEKAMIFINENTMLLIGICIFLILVLIGYLIDNSIKTRKLEKEEMRKAIEEENKAPEAAPVVPEVAETTKEAAPVVEEKEIERASEDLKAEIITEPVVETPVEPVSEPVVETPVVEEPVVTPVEPVIETESMEDLLNKDFSKNAEVVNNLTDTQIIKPVEEVAPVVTEVPAEPEIVETPAPVVETPIVEEKKSPYKSNSKLSDILAKKKENAKPKLETTQDFSDELDRILNKLNEETPKTDNSIDLEEEINNRF